MKSAKNIVADIVGIMAMDIAQIVLLIKSKQRGERKVQTMDDLISRQAVIDLLKKNTTRDIEEVVVTEKNIKLIMDMPKAYDVDAVVAELEVEKERHDADRSYWAEHEWKDRVIYNECDMSDKKSNCFDLSIDIVKRGGVE